MKPGPSPGADLPERSPAREERVTEAAEQEIVRRLRRLGALAEEAGAPTVGRDCRTLAERVAGGRFHVACIGQFKRGKSMRPPPSWRGSSHGAWAGPWRFSM